MPNSNVYGFIRSSSDSAPVIGAVVEALDLGRTIFADTTGAYVLADMPPGRHLLRFSRLGYLPLTVDVLVPTGDSLRLDVTLTAKSLALDKIRVVGAANLVGANRVLAEAGMWSVSGETLRANPPAGEADAFRTLSLSPNVEIAPESPATMHIRGGSADQNLVLLDGVPIYNPIHAGEVFSAINPDMVQRVVLHGAVPSARYGGRLSGIIDVQTRRGSPDTLSARGGFGPTSLRGMVEIPMRADRGTVLLSGRHSYRGLFGRSAGDSLRDGWVDFLAKAAFDIRGGELSGIFYSSLDGLSLGSSVSSPPPPSPVTQGGSAARGIPNRFDWKTSTAALVWKPAKVGSATIENRVWSTVYRGKVAWASADGAAHLMNDARSAGLSSVILWGTGNSNSVASFEVERFPASYRVSSTSIDSVQNVQLLTLQSAPASIVLSVERKQVFGSRWVVNAGMRGTAVSHARARLDPRVSMGFIPMDGAAISVGYARSHQYWQSLRNEESILDAVVGIDAPIAIGAAGMPVARADEVVAIASTRMGSRMRITINGYARWLDGLALVAPSTVEPFAIRSFANGVGIARGLGVGFESQFGGFSGTATYALSDVRRAAFTRTYRPGFAPRHAGSAVGAYKLGSLTRIRAAVWAARGRATTPLTGDFGWEWQKSISRARRFNGTARIAQDSLGKGRLPFYFRVDAGVQRDFPLPRAPALITLFANVDNVLDRRNTIGYSQSQGGGTSALASVPLSFSFGLAWRF